MSIDAPAQPDASTGDLATSEDVGARLNGSDADVAHNGEPTSWKETLARWLHWPRSAFESRNFSFRASLVFHAVAMIVLALWMEPAKPPTTTSDFSAGWQAETPFDAGATEASVKIVAPQIAESAALPVNTSTLSSLASSAPGPLPGIDINEAIESLPTPNVPAMSLRGGGGSTDTSVLPSAIPRGAGLEGRSQRGKIAYEEGATPQSEEAVERGLAWLIAHQFKDGSWHFDHTLDGGPCHGYCRNPGRNGSSTGATAMALLSFYGAGYTHTKGPYQEQLKRGLYYLNGRMLLTANGGDLQEGTMYAQGLSTIALCEAYAMSGDENLRPFADQAVRFVLYAQDRHGGGWRYSPGEPGDTTMHGWQLMALKSATLAGIQVPSPAWQLAGTFLDSVQSDRGASYGYRTRQRTETTSAVGLLCRMYMGWDQKRNALVRGVTHLDKLGPSPTNMYYNYYGTQVMHHYGGEPWYRWNAKMREHLIATQATVGHEAGSWHFDDQHGNAGGRLYNTAMAIMTLEVYYRYMPLYGRRAVTESF